MKRWHFDLIMFMIFIIGTAACTGVIILIVGEILKAVF